MRGIPMLVFLMIMFYVIFSKTGLGGTAIAVLAFAMNFAAYVSEMFRTSIQSVSKGQIEAGLALGLTKWQTFWHITAPQAVKSVMPVYKGEAVSLVKSTSIVGYIAIQDLTRASDITKQEAEEEAITLLRKVGMAEKAYAMPADLSGGQKQRVAIARCLAMHPEVILFDEPTSALDPTMVGEVLSVIRQLAKEGMTMIIVTHEMKFAHDVSTRIFFMYGGYIHEDGTPHQIFEEPVHSATKAFVQRIHKLVFELEGHDADGLSMLSDMSKFCIKYNIADMRDVIEQISTEMLANVLYDYRPMTVRLTYGELKDITAVDFMIKDLTSSPFQAEGFDPKVLEPIKALAKEIIEEPTKLGYRVKVVV